MSTGIAVFAYNRPKHFERTISQVIKYSNHPIYIYVDGADNKATEKKQEEILITINRIQKERESIFLVKSSNNQGLRKSITNGINNTFLYCDKIIVIEDDILVSPSYFKFVDFWLNEANNDNEVLSICGYQFKTIEELLNKSDSIQNLKLPRFMPWGWATWRKKWNTYYYKNIVNLLEVYKDKFDMGLLPVDIQKFCTNKEYLDNIHDTWSIPWTLVHYLSRQYCISPSISLIDNIGFDGTGVHCSSTNIFENSKNHFKDNKIIDQHLTRNIKVENTIRDFLEKKSDITMKKDLKNIEPAQFIEETQTNNSENFLKSLINKTVDKFYFDDIHTHLFPPELKNFSLKGIVNLLNYHYLIPELIDQNDFKKVYDLNKLNSYEIADLAWNKFFLDSIPISTATSGIITVLDQLGIYKNDIKLKELISREESLNYSDEDIFEKARIRNVYMTNDPFNKEEWKLFDNSNWSRDRYKSTIRIDTLFQMMIKNGLDTFDNNINYLNQCLIISKPKYISLSLGKIQLSLLLKDEYRKLMDWIEQTELPFFLMLGVRRGVNKDLKLAGDGLEDFAIEDLTNLLLLNKNINFNISLLDETREHACRVLSRKMPNMKLTGYWWFINNKTQISDLVRKRFEMLGTKHLLFYSDSRVLEQIIYKVGLYRSIIKDALFEKLSFAQSSGFQVTESKVNNLLKQISYIQE